MKSEQQQSNREVQIEGEKPTAPDLTEADISLLIEFFQTLDEWDRQSKMTPSEEDKRSSRASQSLSD
jgi:hypothetical protein